jgi:D-glycero-alpha-D-manno-heptose-7-phosphate kinase
MTETLFRAKAPLRLSFAGGGTDVPPFPAQEGGLVLSATINKHAYGLLRPRPEPQITVESIDYGVSHSYGVDEPLVFDGKLDLIKAAIRNLTDRSGSGYDLLLRSSAPPGSGLGSSSALTVALIGVLIEYRSLPLVDYEIAELAYHLEREDLGIAGGLQDQYAATFGGFNFIEFEGERVIVNPLRIRDEVVSELEQNLLLCYTGTTRASDGIIDDQTSRLRDGAAGTLEGLRKQKELAVEMKNALLQGRLTAFGELLGQAWEYKKQMSPRISTSFIDDLYERACEAGAIGGKITGAGGGGYMLFYCVPHRRHHVAKAAADAGAEVTDFEFDSRGLCTWQSRT